MNHRLIGIFGLGLFGSTIVNTLSKYEYDVIAIDKNEENVLRVESKATQAIIGDFTDIDLLKEVGVKDCDTIIIATAESLESSVIGIMNCHKLGIQNIIIKAKNTTHVEVFKQLGVSYIIQPEKEAGQSVARDIMKQNIQSILDLDHSQTSIVEFYPPSKWIGKTLLELNLRQKYDLNVIGFRKENTTGVIANFSAHYQIQEKETIIAVAISNTFEKYDYLELL